MVFDKIENIFLYLSPKFKSVLEDMNILINNGKEGVFQIIDDEVYLKIMSYETKKEDFITESHRKYIDLQIVFHGEERIELFNPDDIFIKEDYNSENDCVFYETGKIEEKASIKLVPDYFALFFKDDVHKTQICSTVKPITIKKAVLKIDETYFKTK